MKVHQVRLQKRRQALKQYLCNRSNHNSPSLSKKQKMQQQRQRLLIGSMQQHSRMKAGILQLLRPLAVAVRSRHLRWSSRMPGLPQPPSPSLEPLKHRGLLQWQRQRQTVRRLQTPTPCQLPARASHPLCGWLSNQARQDPQVNTVERPSSKWICPRWTACHWPSWPPPQGGLLHVCPQAKTEV